MVGECLGAGSTKEAFRAIRKLAAVSTWNMYREGPCHQHRGFSNTCRWLLHTRSVGKGRDEKEESKSQRDFQLHRFCSQESLQLPRRGVFFLSNLPHKSTSFSVSLFRAAKYPYLAQRPPFCSHECPPISSICCKPHFIILLPHPSRVEMVCASTVFGKYFVFTWLISCRQARSLRTDGTTSRQRYIWAEACRCYKFGILWRSPTYLSCICRNLLYLAVSWE